MCEALCSPAEREAFKRDEEAFMARFKLTDEEKNLIRKRDFKRLIEAGMNIYAMLKIGSATGNSLYKMGAQMRGESYEEFLKTRTISGAVEETQDGQNRRRHPFVSRPLGRECLRPRQAAGPGVEAALRRLCPGARMAGETEARRGDRRLQRPRRRVSLRQVPDLRARCGGFVCDRRRGLRHPAAAGGAGRCRFLDSSLRTADPGRVRPDRLPGDGRRARLPRADEPLLSAHAGRMAGEERAAADQCRAAS